MFLLIAFLLTNAIGFGTYTYQGEVCEKAVTDAYAAGYRIVNTAAIYENFDPIANAIANIGREHLTIISKVWHNSLTSEGIKADIHKTLDALKTLYLDIYLIHWPNSQVPIEESLQAMNELREQSLIRQIGLSNVTKHHVVRALETGIPISWVQVEMNPGFCDFELLSFCKENNIGVQAWGPLGRGELIHDPELTAIGKKYNKTASQIALRWIHQLGALPLPASTKPDHIRENLDIFDFSLTPEEMSTLNTRAKNGKRLRIVPDYELGFEDEFDFTYPDCWPKTK